MHCLELFLIGLSRPTLKNYDRDEDMGDGGGVKIGDPPQKQYQTVALQVIRSTAAQPQSF